VLAAAEVAGVARVFAVGGPAAIGAMAFGTETVPRVDRIVGPGNAYVTEAKAQAARVTGTDMLAGTSELLIIADEGADLAAVAREMLAEAEHDPRACVVAIVVGGHADTLVTALTDTVNACERRVTIRDALAAQGGVLSASSSTEALEFANAFAPARLLLAVQAPSALLPMVRNAGVVSLGVESSLTFGAYLTGASNVLPTGGLAAAHSALSLEHFFRWTTWQRVEAAAAYRLAGDAVELASAEGLEAHARAAAAWGVQR
jgi:histidinol dehydrogenase